MRVQDALRIGRRARGVHDERHVVRVAGTRRRRGRKRGEGVHVRRCLVAYDHDRTERREIGAKRGDELAAYLRGRVAHFEQPARWWVHDGELPKNEAGKILKRVLREQWVADQP